MMKQESLSMECTAKASWIKLHGHAEFPFLILIFYKVGTWMALHRTPIWQGNSLPFLLYMQSTLYTQIQSDTIIIHC